MKNIVVCIKQVPATQKVEVDPLSGVLKRDGVESKMNPYDCYAMQTAIEIQKRIGAAIHVVTMGPPSASEVLKEGFALGAQEGWLLSDRKFAGADVLATAYTLANGISQIGSVDLILCGKQTSDGDTAQVGPEIAEVLGIPHVSWAEKLVDVDDTSITLKQDLGGYEAIVRLTYPCLVTVEKGIYQPDLPSYRKKIASKDYPIHVLNAAMCDHLDVSRIGLAGSPTQVERVFTPVHEVQTLRLEGNEAASASQLIEILKAEKFLEAGE